MCARKKTEGKCRLCGKVDLLCKSHIIPKFMYSPLKDEYNRMHLAQIDKSQDSIIWQAKQDANLEPLLCLQCEGLLSDWEHYAKRILWEKENCTIKGNGYLSVVPAFEVYENLDYRRMKLFLLSLIWRASVSSIQMFRNVRLGKHEEKIGKMLLTGDPGNFDDYPCAMISTREKSGIHPGLILQPKRTRVNGTHSTNFYIAGIVFAFYISKFNVPPGITKLAIQQNGTLILPLSDGPLSATIINTLSNMDIF